VLGSVNMLPEPCRNQFPLWREGSAVMSMSSSDALPTPLIQFPVSAGAAGLYGAVTRRMSASRSIGTRPIAIGALKLVRVSGGVVRPPRQIPDASQGGVGCKRLVTRGLNADPTLLSSRSGGRRATDSLMPPGGRLSLVTYPTQVGKGSAGWILSPYASMPTPHFALR
jgi:hypothetical protein